MTKKLVRAAVTVGVAAVLGCSTSPARGEREPVLAGVLEARPRPGGEPFLFDVDRRDSLAARFLAVYLIDTLGAVELPSVRFVSEARPVFRRGVCQSLSGQRHEPVRRAGALRRAVVIGEYRYLYRGNIPTDEPAGARYDSARAAIARKGVGAALDELATMPGCPV